MRRRVEARFPGETRSFTNCPQEGLYKGTRASLSLRACDVNDVEFVNVTGLMGCVSR